MHARFNHPAIALVTRVLAAGLSFVFGIVAARVLGIETYGVVSVLLGFINVGVVFALLGHETLATREIAAICKSVDEDAAQTYSRSASRQVWVAAFVVMGLLFFALSLLPLGVSAGPHYLALLLLIPMVARTRLSQGVIRGAHLASLSIVPDGIVRPALTVLLVCALVVAEQQAAYGFTAVMLVCALLGLIVGLRWERRALKTIRQQPGLRAASDMNVRPKSFSKPIFLSSILAVLVSQLALIATGLLANPDQAGLYAAAERFSLAAALVGQAVYLAVASQFSALFAEGNLESMRALIRKVTRSVSVATLVICAAIALASTPLLALYGSTFDGAASALQVLLLSVLINACAGPTGQVLLMTRHERDHFAAMTVGLLAQSLFIAVLVPAYGVLGAAWAVLASTLVWNSLMMYYIRRRLSVNPWLAFA